MQALLRNNRWSYYVRNHALQVWWHLATNPHEKCWENVSHKQQQGRGNLCKLSLLWLRSLLKLFVLPKLRDL